MISSRRQYRFQPPALRQIKTIYDFSSGMNTRDLDIQVPVRLLQNARAGRSSGFKKRPGQTQKGNVIGTGSGIAGLHSYVKKDKTATLLASWGTDIYRYTETVSPSVIATSTSSQATGYGKDRHLFFTNSVDADGNPWLVATYQSGSGILLEWSASPYTNWSNAPVTIDSSAQIGWSCFLDSSDNIHVAYMADANTVKYVKLSFSAGPSWTAGTKVTVDGSGSGASAYKPSIVADSSGSLYVSYTWTDGASVVQVNAAVSKNGGASWSRTSLTSVGAPGSWAASTALTLVLGVPYLVAQKLSLGSSPTSFLVYVWNGGTGAFIFGGTLGGSYGTTDSQFSLVPLGSTYAIYSPAGSSPDGVSATVLGSSVTSAYREFSVVSDGSSDKDVQYKNNAPAGAGEDAVATRVTNDSNDNRFPSSVEVLSANAAFVPVMWTEGTGSPYNVKINNPTNWVALSASLTAGNQVYGATMPSTGAGGTDCAYFVNGADAPKKWDGTSLTTATATGFPIARHVVAFDNRLWFFGPNNRAYYTNLGADNFSGTFPSGNNVDFPEYVVGGFVYRDRVLLVFTDKGIYTVQNFDYTGANVGPEQVGRIPNSYGTLSIRSVRQVGYWVYFQSPDGIVRRTNGQYVEEPSCSDMIRPTLQGTSLSQLSKSAAGQYQDYYKLSVVGSGSGVQDTVFVLDTIKAPDGGWGVDKGQSLSCFVSHPDSNGVYQLYAGDAATGIVYQNETGLNDNGTAIAMDVQTGTVFAGDFYDEIVRDTMVLASSQSSGTLTIGIAPVDDTSSFSSQSVSLSAGSSSWGIGSWNDGRTWGGNTTINQRLVWNRQAGGFKFRFYNAETSTAIAATGIAVSHETARTIT